EESNYPISRTIKYMTSAARYTYEVIEEGIQPPESYLARTLKPNAFPIPDEYIVETTYGKAKNTVTYSVKYIAKKPHFTIVYGPDPDDFVCSNLSATAAANAYIIMHNKKKVKEAAKRGLEVF